jgi:hypothetical protein
MYVYVWIITDESQLTILIFALFNSGKGGGGDGG